MDSKWKYAIIGLIVSSVIQMMLILFLLYTSFTQTKHSEEMVRDSRKEVIRYID